MTFLIVCGFWSSETTSLLCIASVLLALIFDVLVLEYVYFLVFKGEIFCNEKINNVDKAAVIEKAELQRATLFATLGNRMLRPFIVHLYEPLKEEYFKVTTSKIPCKNYYYYYFFFRNANKNNWPGSTSVPYCRTL